MAFTKQEIAERIYYMLQNAEFIKFFDNDFYEHTEKQVGAKTQDEIIARIKTLL